MLANAFVILSLVAFLVWQVLEIRLIETMREKYPDFYTRLGKPPAPLSSPIRVRAAWSFMSYIFSNKFQFDDPPDQIADAFTKIKWLMDLTLVFFILAGVSSIFSV